MKAPRTYAVIDDIIIDLEPELKKIQAKIRLQAAKKLKERMEWAETEADKIIDRSYKDTLKKTIVSEVNDKANAVAWSRVKQFVGSEEVSKDIKAQLEALTTKGALEDKINGMIAARVDHMINQMIDHHISSAVFGTVRQMLEPKASGIPKLIEARVKRLLEN
jgi:vacuolar-type H+-ATPase subunit E/Vma4